MSLTESELELIERLGQVMVDYTALDHADDHPWAAEELAHTIHQAQRIIMARAARRAHPNRFETLGKRRRKRRQSQ